MGHTRRPVALCAGGPGMCKASLESVGKKAGGTTRVCARLSQQIFTGGKRVGEKTGMWACTYQGQDVFIDASSKEKNHEQTSTFHNRGMLGGI